MGIYPAVVAPQGNFPISQNHCVEFKLQKTFVKSSSTHITCCNKHYLHIIFKPCPCLLCLNMISKSCYKITFCVNLLDTVCVFGRYPIGKKKKKPGPTNCFFAIFTSMLFPKRTCTANSGKCVSVCVQRIYNQSINSLSCVSLIQI